MMPLPDALGRPLEALRISVTDRCNLRCTYCMPRAAFANHPFLAPDRLLTFDEIERLARIFLELGVHKIRLTGGEPLLRPGLADLVRQLAPLPVELALSTNALLLRGQAAALRKAGLQRLNISLDAIDNAVFGEMNGLGVAAENVLAGIDEAQARGFTIKLNMVVQRGVNDAQVLPMARHFAARNIPLRFIEFMDVGNNNQWDRAQVFSGADVLELLRGEFDLAPQPGPAADTERRFRCTRTGAQFGFVNSVTAPFCRDCNRLRLSADGKLFTCLFARTGHDLGRLVRAGAPAEEIAATIRAVWTAREDRYSELRATSAATEPKVEMSYIGG
jgi:cyclic pyranopterin phosphate synthase